MEKERKKEKETQKEKAIDAGSEKGRRHRTEACIHTLTHTHSLSHTHTHPHKPRDYIK